MGQSTGGSVADCNNTVKSFDLCYVSIILTSQHNARAFSEDFVKFCTYNKTSIVIITA
jgi:hypothetical protein